MALQLRIFLIVAAVLTLAFVLRKIRKSQVKIADAVFWFFLVLLFIVLAVFPDIVYACAAALGVESPVNFVFLCIVAVLFIKEFTASLEIAKLKAKLSQLVQDEALNENEASRTKNL